MQSITILGATGSIGENTLDVISRHPDKYSVYALTAHHKVTRLLELCLLYRPKLVVIGTTTDAKFLEQALKEHDLPTQVTYGSQALCDAASADEVDVVMAAIVGGAGLAPTLAAASAGKKILLANKEALVMSGNLFLAAAERSGATILPVDSEHNAIFQALPMVAQLDRKLIESTISKIILTASGGPFRQTELALLEQVTPDSACAHPNWVMGRKISVDSATMMNKGLEVIEAHFLFNLPKEKIEVLIHPQSIVHSLVAYADGSMLAQLGEPDMRIPIAHSLGFPERLESGSRLLDLTKAASLTFEEPDLKRFPCLDLAFQAMHMGDSAPIILNAANEIAVAAFLDGQIAFTRIPDVVARCLERLAVIAVDSIETIFHIDKMARETALEQVKSLKLSN
ncbi:1-deoxy-D-xylulose-5-phosphate reductoisomerase [Ampullimonas aquatilis]|uniref:1-deoxy-D-xylulose-5-phosphate reductoisomerase n=1 Tax=Ampullimonas aquatilis TaxID=1341549 RepID=UPI003C75291D